MTAEKQSSTASNSLTGKAKKQLRGLGHHLQPVVYIGKEGITDSVIRATSQALHAHELVKIKLGQNCPLDKHSAAEAIARQTESTLVQLLGKTVLLYQPNPDLPIKKRIVLQ